jgi:hypothetical protein
VEQRDRAPGCATRQTGVTGDGQKWTAQAGQTESQPERSADERCDGNDQPNLLVIEIFWRDFSPG